MDTFEEKVVRLITELRSRDEDRLRRARQELQEIAGDEATEIILDRMHSKYAESAEYSNEAEALALVAKPTILERVINEVKPSAKGSFLYAHVDQILEHFGEASLPYITSALYDPEFKTKHLLIEPLGRIPGQKSVEILVEFIRKNGPEHGYDVIKALEFLIRHNTDISSAGPLLRTLFAKYKDQPRPDPYTIESWFYYELVLLLGEMGDSIVLPTLFAFVEDIDHPAQHTAVLAMGNYNNEQVKAKLREYAAGIPKTKRVIGTRHHAIISLGKLGEIETVAKYLDDPKLSTAAKTVLGDIGTPEALAAIDAWQQTRKDENP